MHDIFSTPLFGITISLGAYVAGSLLHKKTGLTIVNPVVIAIAIIIPVLLLTDTDYTEYYNGGQYINMLLTPATACLALPIFRKLEVLKKNWIPILAGCAAGAVVCVVCVTLLCSLFGLDEQTAMSVVPKSITMPFGIELSESLGGIPSVTVICILITGITGAISAPFLIKLFRINDAVAEGLAIGTASHVLGTSKALEIGETQGAMSGLAVPIAGAITVIYALITCT